MLSLVLNKRSSRHPAIWKTLEVREGAKTPVDRWRQRPVTPRPPTMPLLLVMRCRLPWWWVDASPGQGEETGKRSQGKMLGEAIFLLCTPQWSEDFTRPPPSVDQGPLGA